MGDKSSLTNMYASSITSPKLVLQSQIKNG